MSDLEIFLNQNPLTAASLTPEQLEAIEPYAEHHAGGLFVLGKHLEGDRYAKVHDSWGDDGSVVLHAYDPDEPDDPAETITEYATGHEAIVAFLSSI